MSLVTEERIAPYMRQQFLFSYEETCNLWAQNYLFHFPSFILFKYRVESTQNSLKVHVANDGAKIERLLNINQVTVLNGLKYFLIANESYFKTKIQVIFGYEIKKNYTFFSVVAKNLCNLRCEGLRICNFTISPYSTKLTRLNTA